MAELRADLRVLKTFVTLSPVLGFRRWFRDARDELRRVKAGPAVLERLRRLEDQCWTTNPETCRRSSSWSCRCARRI